MLFLIDVSRQHVTLKVVNHHQIDQFVYDNFLFALLAQNFTTSAAGQLRTMMKNTVYTQLHERVMTHIHRSRNTQCARL